MKKVSAFVSILGLAILASSCCKSVIDTQLNVIPQPSSVEVYEGRINIAGADFSIDNSFDSIAVNALRKFESNLVSASGIATGESGNRIIVKKSESLASEEYNISVNHSSVTIKASSAKGVLYALETLKQLLPLEIYDGGKSGCEDNSNEWTLPYMSIKDEPRFSYRGMHLDVSRHFFDVSEVKKYLDIMAIHKMNIFHWHLTDDQGWRIEIKKYPKLTEYGAIRKHTLIGHLNESCEYDNTPYGEGCYYSQEQIKEVIEYAAAKGIEIIPEIDMPGHMLAALACYPELGCTGGPYEVWGRWGVADDVICAGKESSMEFLEDILAEVVELFPCRYVHIGGDECPKVRWQECPHCQAKIAELGLKDDENHQAEHYLQSYVTNRMEKFLNERGKSLIGWDEILEGELAPNATVMSWRGVSGGEKAAEMGHDAIMVPSSHLYFDHCQAKDRENEPLSIGGYLPIDKVYSFEPYGEAMSEEEKSHIIGVQANLWTEYIHTPEHLEYMLLPRMSAVSEVQWCRKDERDFDGFMSRMPSMIKIYEYLGYNYAKDKK